MGWGLLILGLLVVSALAFFAKGIGGRLEEAGKNLASFIRMPDRDFTTTYLEKFIEDNKDPKFQSLKALAREIQMPELEKIYLSIRLAPEISQAETRKGLEKLERDNLMTRVFQGRPAQEREFIDLAEAFTHNSRHLAIIGIAGSGKSTLLQWAGLACARAHLGHTITGDPCRFVEALTPVVPPRNPRNLLDHIMAFLDHIRIYIIRAFVFDSPPTPIFFPLGAFDRYCQREAGGLHTSAALLKFAAGRFNRLHEAQPLPPGFLEQVLQRGALLLFDGVDEIDPDHRGSVRAAIQSLLSDYPNARTVSLLTSRPAAYFGEAQASRFHRCDIQPLSEGLRNELIRSLHMTIYPDSDKAARESNDLIRRIQASDQRIQQLAETPLLVTIFALVHRGKRKLPEQRAELYEEAITTLLEESYRKDEAEGSLRTTSETDPKLRRDRLALVAFHLHEKRIGDEGLLEGDLIDLIWRKFGADESSSRTEVQRFLYSIANRGGLLEEQDRRFGFRSHRTFQEYLAGRYLAREYAPADLAKQGQFLASRLHDDHWEEPVRLAAGYLAIEGQGEVEAFIKMINGLGGDDAFGDRATALACLALSDLPDTHLKSPHPSRTTIIKDSLRVSEQNPPRVELALRRRLGLALAALSDPRFARPLWERDARALSQYFIPIPTGPFRMGTSQADVKRLKGRKVGSNSDENLSHLITLPSFGLGRWPVTNADYRCFIEADDYANSVYWPGETGLWFKGDLDLEKHILLYPEDMRVFYRDWLEKRPLERRRQPYYWNDLQWNAANLPVVGITWFEARAYCFWLTARLRVAKLINDSQSVHLPTEAQWEKAARIYPAPGPAGLPYVDGRLWPWGDQWDNTCCNSHESSVNGTTPVGLYPNGASGFGVEDMAGNVLEWTSTASGPKPGGGDFEYPYSDKDGREDPNTLALRVVRGGSWYHDRWFCRATIRSWIVPVGSFDYLGFRVALSPL